MDRVVRYTVILLVLLSSVVVSNADPIRWSAPMNEYPTQWYPTAPPPQQNPYGYQYPAGYGYGYGTWGQYPSGYQGFSGNPYHGYYGY
ncbi:hypothetical protein [Desulfomonile tiedjei]|uniref:Uncharacterized protein n=1 Tax=Desulfomonile tiedjei (strain ATCC 49306 / DSM 6799 / DCB-1) TaxID=706587 RepID=I4CDH7_DESTA|nr:hypothetical protein [Desulfomonile tiedjei]AFM27618.1 hypothetical protein Desti_5006 [Desulfomonile tiedjei DSM 6799]